MRDNQSSIIPFDFDGAAVRVVMRGTSPWFVLADVCRVLEYRDAFNASRNLDGDEKDTQIVSTPGGDQEMTIINESGLYSLILTSRKAAAKRFKKWVTSEVLPAIRQTGRYEVERDADDGMEVPAHAMAAARVPTTREINAFTKLIGEVRRMAGRDSAVVVYVQTPLQQSYSLPADLSGEVAMPVRASARMPRRLDGRACLRRLLSTRIARMTITVGDVVRIADDDSITRNSLAGLGVRRDPENWRGWLAVAASHPRLQYIYTGSVWAQGWETALQTLPGALVGEISGFDRRRRSVLIPMETVEQVMGWIVDGLRVPANGLGVAHKEARS